MAYLSPEKSIIDLHNERKKANPELFPQEQSVEDKIASLRQEAD